jgi:MFS family permease
MSDDYRRLRTAAIGTALVFTASGTVLGAWVSRLPAVREHLHASPGQLGIALLAMGIGSLLSMPLTGYLCRWFGSRQVVAVNAVLGAVALAALGQVDTLVQLGAVLFGFGLVYGSWDVAMNVQGSHVDQRAGRAWMPRYHACWSAGSIAGAALGAFAASRSIGVGTHFAVNAVACALVVAVGLVFYVEERGGPVPAAGAKRGRFVNRALLLIGAITLVATTIEGAAADWLAIYLADERGVSHASAALAFSVFAVAMTVGRFAGTPVSERLGRATAVRIGGVLSIAGVLLVVLQPVLALSYLGALLWGAGICLVFPAAVSAAGETARPAESIAFVTTLGYGAILVGPPLIGALADQVGLGRALLVLVALGAAVAILAPAVSVRERVDRPVDAHVGDRVGGAERLREQPDPQLLDHPADLA